MTIRSLWDNAGMKENLIFSLVSEDFKEYDFSYIPSNQLYYKHFPLTEHSLEYRGGVCWSRNLATQVPVDYDYYVQFDSHTLAVKDWDIMALSAYENLKHVWDKIIISGHPADYEYLPDGTINFYQFPLTPTYVENLEGLVPGYTFPKYNSVPLKEYKESAWITGCYIFAPKAWVDEIGIEKQWSFNVEEFMMTIKSFNFGWKVLSYGQRHVFHHSSHTLPDGSITRNRFRPWADSRANAYWQHVYRETDKLSYFMSEPIEGMTWMGLYNFFDVNKLDRKYLEYIPDYHQYGKSIKRQNLGMPPRN